MAGLDIKATRNAIATVLEAASIGQDVAVYAYSPGPDPDIVTGSPAILIGHAPGTDYRLTFGARGLAQLKLEIEIRCTSADGVSAELALDDLLNAGTGATSSIFDALTADPTFGGVVGNSELSDPTPPRPVRPGGSGPVAYWSASFTLTIYQPRS